MSFTPGPASKPDAEKVAAMMPDAITFGFVSLTRTRRRYFCRRSAAQK
jgi:hypothetical protein